MPSKKRIISTPKAPAAIGAYSQAVAAGDFIFVSGQIPLDPATGEMIEGNIEAQTEAVMRHIAAILQEAGSGLEHVVKVSILLADLGDFQKVNQVYAGFFPQEPPARATYQVAGLPKGALLEVETIALRPR